MFIETWFPTPIFYSFAPCDIQERIQEEYLLAESNIKGRVTSGTWDNNISTTFNTTKNIITECGLNTLKEYILAVSDKFIKELYSNAGSANMIESWVNYNNKYQFQDKHCHQNSSASAISGVYYLQTNTEDGKLVFHPPSQMMVNTSRTPTALTFNSVEYKPEVGKIVLFPSWVEHSVRANMTDSTRISVSFNIEV